MWAEGRQLHLITALRLVISQLQRGAESFKEEERQRRWPPQLPGHCPPVSSPVKHLQIVRPIEITCGFNLPQTSDTACPIPPKKQPDPLFVEKEEFLPLKPAFFTLNWIEKTGNNFTLQHSKCLRTAYLHLSWDCWSLARLFIKLFEKC